MFARLVQDGIVRQYLADHCPDDHLRLCAYRKQLPTSADDWLWSYSSPLHKLGWWRAFEPEANRIIRESLAYYPGRHLKTALVATVQQFVYFKTGEGMGSNDNWHAELVFAIVAPRVLDAFRASRQQHDEFDFTLVNMVQIPIAWLSIMTLILVLLGERRPERSAAGLAIVCLIALVANAAICGTFSNPNDRYQSRLVWLAAFATWVVLFNRRTTVKLKHDQVTG